MDRESGQGLYKALEHLVQEKSIQEAQWQLEPRPMEKSFDKAMERVWAYLGGDQRQHHQHNRRPRSQDGVKGEKMMEVMAKLVNHLFEKESKDSCPESDLEL